MDKYSRRLSRIISLKPIAALLALGCGLATIPAANATLITFDNLTQPNCDDPLGCDSLAVGNQYAALGVVFSGAALFTGPGPYGGDVERSPPNAISDLYGPGMAINFTGALPTTVSFYMSAGLQDALYVDASGPAGAVGSFISDGWRGPMYPDPLYHDLQLVTFTGAEISHLSFNGFYDRRGDIIIDDLSFTSDQMSVPEPSALSLFTIGFGLLLLRRKWIGQ